MVKTILSATKAQRTKIGGEVVSRCREIGCAPFSDMTEGLFRAYLTPAHAATINKVGSWMRDAGMSVRVDAAANLIGRYEGSEPEAPALLIGSHLDSVRDAGVFDGPLGVLLGIACVEQLHEADRRLLFPIEVIGFGDEEGSRFHTSMVSSRAVAGALSQNDLLISDAENLSLLEALHEFSKLIDFELPTGGPLAAKRDKLTVLAYLEAHIEQGPILQAEDLALGAVKGISAQLRHSIVIKGSAAHAGTTTMALRKDALAGAAGMVSVVEHIARSYEDDLVATVGHFSVHPGSSNVIPGEVKFTTDIRSLDIKLRDEASKKIFRKFREIAKARELDIEITMIQDLPASFCDSGLVQLMSTAIALMGEPPLLMTSGAGHDAMVMADLCPTAMLFIRCKDGVSHHPEEDVMAHDVGAALYTMLEFIYLLAERSKNDN